MIYTLYCILLSTDKPRKGPMQSINSNEQIKKSLAMQATSNCAIRPSTCLLTVMNSVTWSWISCTRKSRLKKNDGWTDNTRVKRVKKMKKAGFSTVDKILDDILQTLPLEFQENVKEMTCDDFIIKQHFNLGMTIKDKYFYKNKTREQLITSLDNKKKYVFLDGDVFSGIVLEKLYTRITKPKENWKGESLSRVS